MGRARERERGSEREGGEFVCVSRFQMATSGLLDNESVRSLSE